MALKTLSSSFRYQRLLTSMDNMRNSYAESNLSPMREVQLANQLSQNVIAKRVELYRAEQKVKRRNQDDEPVCKEVEEKDSDGFELTGRCIFCWRHITLTLGSSDFAGTNTPPSDFAGTF